ncbi:uncharacterized protein TM35_000082920 [Trypanosoma theileri]|uniref:Uncharacterized protein n=1 Tax=Trypanosoma theileri TaxID=67003 RepID=A0A1X0P0M3_9TRYP|nr:uncharacterized protein TM35_000082920 [Trypanosoma theileri]ORC90494.1 hypothetical protein TM35_000082920 [Trypanosoma theileri]
MNVAELLNNRVKEVALFSNLLFRKRPRTDGNSDISSAGERTVLRYRRPSSANIPLLDVVRSARTRLKRVRRFTRLTADEELTSSSMESGKESVGIKKKRFLTYPQWCLLLRRRRRLAWRRRPTACRRNRRRLLELRFGKLQYPLCNCNVVSNNTSSVIASDTSDDWRNLLTRKRRTVVLWLPSHQQLCRRFHYRVVKRRIDGCAASIDNIPHPVTIRIAVPVKSQRKQHRVLQRWAARLPTVQSSLNPLRRPVCKPTAIPPPMCFLTERSHLCVWMIESLGTDSNISATSVMDALMMRTNGTPSVALNTKSLFKEAQTSFLPHKTWKRGNNNVFYGHMWFASHLEKDDVYTTTMLHDRSDVSENEALIVPVVLVQSILDSGMRYYLIASAPVYICSRARRQFNIQLVSHWNPCGISKAICSVFEVWCCADAVRAQENNKILQDDNNESLVLKWVQRRVDAAVMKWLTSAQSISHTQSKGEKIITPLLLPITKTTSIFVFPSLAPNIETVNYTVFPIHQCAMTILVLSNLPTPSPRCNKKCRVELTSLRETRKRHFQLSRHIFASLSTVNIASSSRSSSSTTTTTTSKTSSCRKKSLSDDKTDLFFANCKKLGYTQSVRIIGEDEREALLRLIGCPAFTDIGGSNPSFKNSRRARLLCSPSNAHQRVLIKFVMKGGRKHQCSGSALLLLNKGIPAILTHIGIITSEPFFSMRFGCRLAYAWVWEQTGWELIQHYLGNTEAQTLHYNSSKEKVIEEITTSVEKKANMSFFVCALSKLDTLLPFLSGSPTHVPGCSLTTSQRKKKQQYTKTKGTVSTSSLSVNKTNWQVVEKALSCHLCDEDTCYPVDVIRVGIKASTTHHSTHIFNENEENLP